MHFDGQEGLTRDFSSKGVYFLAAAALEPGSTIDMNVTLEHLSVEGPVTLHLRARVVRVDVIDDVHGLAAAIEAWDVTDPGLPAVFRDS